MKSYNAFNFFFLNPFQMPYKDVRWVVYWHIFYNVLTQLNTDRLYQTSQFPEIKNENWSPSNMYRIETFWIILYVYLLYTIIFVLTFPRFS